MSAKVTIVVPIYNVEKYVGKCLESLINQTFNDFEVWAIIDGSPDNSADIVKRYSDKDDRIKLIQKENGGYGSVLQYGVDNIKSKYFLICDPDDWLASDAIERLYNFAESKNVDITVADKYNVYIEDNNKHYINTFSKKYNIIPKKVYDIPSDIQKFSFGYVSPHAKLYRTSIAKNISFPNKVSFTDYLLYIMCLSKAKRVAYYDKALAYYLINRPGNTATDIRKSTITDLLIVWEATFNQLKMATNDNSVLIYRMYTQLKIMLLEYRRIVKGNLEDKYAERIVKEFECLQPYKKQIKNLLPDNKKKLLLEGFLHDSTCLITAKYYCKHK